jgi:hypothetical protein
VNAWKSYLSKLLTVFMLLPLATTLQARDSAYYHGPISADANTQFFKGIADQTVSRLVIDSTGGEVEAGIALGQWVNDNNIDVIVEGYCLSSCANYVFPAGRQKIIRPGAVVGWHGNYHHLAATGLWRDDVRRRMRRDGEDEATATRIVRKQVDKLVALEKRFFALIGVNEFVCWVGKMPPYNIPAYYFMSVQDMAHFGIRSVTAPADYVATDMSHHDVDIRLLELPGKDGPGDEPPAMPTYRN